MSDQATTACEYVLSDEDQAPEPSASAPRPPRPKPVVFGRIKLPWAQSCTPIIGPWAGYTVPAGWVLPGGKRLTDRMEALVAAERLHAIVTRAEWAEAGA